MNKRKINVAFLFGAGAEGTGNFGLVSGYEYLKYSLFSSEYFSAYRNALAIYMGNNMFFDGTYKYRKDVFDAVSFLLKNFLLTKIENDVGFLKKYSNEILSLLSDEDIALLSEESKDIKMFIESLKIEKAPAQDKKEINEKITSLKDSFKEIMTGQIVEYDSIREDMYKELFHRSEDGKISFDLNVGVAGSLDGYFHAIKDPGKYGKGRFSKVYNYYWACYFTVLHGVLQFLKNNDSVDVGGFLTENNELNYMYVLQNLRELTKILYSSSVTVDFKNSYYHYIADGFRQNEDTLLCSGVLTSNYYRFVETVSSEIAYLNGQLKLFEYPETLEVMDFSEENKNATETSKKIYFPFIFGQSHVKPIVHSHQIKAFNKAIEILKCADVLVVLGFNISEDDNHINALLHEFVQDGKRLIVTTNDRSSMAHKQLKCGRKNIDYCFVQYGNNQEVVKSIFDKIMM